MSQCLWSFFSGLICFAWVCVAGYCFGKGIESMIRQQVRDEIREAEECRRRNSDLLAPSEKSDRKA